MMSKTFRVTALIVLAALVAMAAAQFTLAKGKPGGGGTGDTGDGTIYFRDAGVFSSMDSDGGFKTSLGIDQGEPSYELHGGQRWFLGVRKLTSGETYPNGSSRRELFAFSESGAVVQLTDQPSLEVWGRGFRWTPGDEDVSWTARRWETTTDPMTGQTVFTGDVIEGGIYGAGVSFELGDPVLLSQPADPVVPVELVVSQAFWEAYEDGPTLAPNVGSHSWSPLAAFVVYDLLDERNKGLWIADPVSGTEFQLSSDGRSPDWSPDGGKIAYHSSAAIFSINPDGTGAKEIINGTATQFLGPPHWSPTASHLTYFVNDHKRNGPIEGTTHVYRATATGGAKTNLTRDSNSASPVAWR